jgi:DNA mismatch repair protein MutS
VPGVVNAHVSAREWKDEIVFLRKIVPGRSDRSYGIQVARLAGLPAAVVRRASDILKSLEQDEMQRGGRPSLSSAAPVAQQQLGLFHVADPHPALDRLRTTDVDRLSPLDALNLIAELKKSAVEDHS